MPFFASSYLNTSTLSIVSDNTLTGSGTVASPLTLVNPVSAAQVALIESSLQPGTNISVLNNDANYIDITQAQTAISSSIAVFEANVVIPNINTTVAQGNAIAALQSTTHNPLTLGDSNNPALALDDQQLTLTLPSEIETALQPNDNVSELVNNLNYQTQAQVDSAITTAIDDLISSAPTTLDTLGELAEAFLDNEEAINTITTVTTNQNAVITDIQDQVTLLDSDITAIEQVNGTQDNAIVAIQGVNATQAASILSLQTQNTRQDNDIEALQIVDNNQDTIISGLQATGTTILSDLAIVQAVAHDAVTLSSTSNSSLTLNGQELNLTLPSEIDTAIQPGDNISALNNDAGFLTSVVVPVTSVNGQIGDVIVNSLPFGFFFERTDTEAGTDITNYLNTSVTIPETGVYEVQFYMLLKNSAISRNYRIQGSVGGIAIHADTNPKSVSVEPKDSGNDIREPVTFRRCVTLTAGNRGIILRFFAQGTDAITVYYANVTVKRFS